MYTFGIGATLDLPEFSVLVLGLDFWERDQCPPIVEHRLLAAVQEIVGSQVRELRLPPAHDENDGDNSAGIPVVPYPRWMRCTKCGVMAPLEQGIFDKKENLYQPLRYVHTHCQKTASQQKPPTAIPVRFLLACPAGHLSDVPWNEFVHDGKPCMNPVLIMNEFGITGDVSDIFIKCEGCGKRKQLSRLVEELRGDNPAFSCFGLYPHLRQQSSKNCEERAHLMNLGASNLWFGQTVSVLSIPDTKSELVELIRKHWNELEDVTSEQEIIYLAKPKRIARLADYKAAEVLQVINDEKSSLAANADPQNGNDIKAPEWDLLSGTTQIDPGQKLELVKVDPPEGFDDTFDKGMLVPRLTEIMTMYGFTRITTQQELDLGIIAEQKVAPLTRQEPTWLPAYETHGEGIFLRFREDRLGDWESSPRVVERDKKFFQAHQAWRKSRHFKDIAGGYPGIRYVLLHSFSHALMQQIVLDCGYTAASIKERIYCRTPAMSNGPMAGVLLYTAAADSEGTLGGLVSLGNPKILGRYIIQAIQNMALCSSDPLCAEREPVPDGRGIHGAACHACLFSPETSCECGNRYLDRNLLVETFAGHGDLAFWKDVSLLG